MIVDYRKRRTEHAPILIDGAVVEQVERFKYLGVTNKRGWSKNTKTVAKRARQNLFPFRRLKGTKEPIPRQPLFYAAATLC
jgi:hypothetical protein